MDVIVTNENKIESLGDLTFSERFSVALKRVKYKGDRGMSQKDFARYAEISTSLVSKILSGDARPNDTVRKKMNLIIDRVYV